MSARRFITEWDPCGSGVARLSLWLAEDQSMMHGTTGSGRAFPPGALAVKVWRLRAKELMNTGGEPTNGTSDDRHGWAANSDDRRGGTQSTGFDRRRS